MLIYMGETLGLIANSNRKMLETILQGEHKQTESGVVYIKLE